MPSSQYRMLKAAPRLDTFAEQQLKRASRLKKQGDLESASTVCKEFLRLFPDDGNAIFLLGSILLDMERYEEAERHLSKGETLYPNNWKILTILSRVKLKLGDQADAWLLIRKASKIAPHDSFVKTGLAEVNREERNYSSAIKILKNIIKRDPTVYKARMLLGDCYHDLGDTDLAASIYKELFDEGYKSLPMVERMVRLPANLCPFDVFPLLRQFGGAPNIDRARFLGSRAYALHNAGRYEEAWSDLVAANQIYKRVRAGSWRSAQADREAAIEHARRYCAPPLAPRAGRDPLSLFILGLSRSGKSTLERLLGLLPGVTRGFENLIVSNAARQASENSGRALFRQGEFSDQLPRDLAGSFLKFYLAELKERAGKAAVFTNTNPGLISRIVDLSSLVPNYRFVFMQRREEDLLLRVYMKTYKSGNSYAYDIKWIKEYLDWYYNIVDIAMEKLPKKCLLISYEDMVDDPEGTVRSVSELCGIGGRLTSPLSVGDDRGVSKPYHRFIAEALTR